MNELSDYEYYDDNYDEECDINLEIDKFISYQTDNIMNIYYDIKDRIPYFLDKLTFSDFLQFIIYLKFSHIKYSNVLRVSKQKMLLYDYFISEFKSEINNLLYVINLYIEQYKIQIDYSTFVLLCLKYTSVLIY